MKLKAKKGLEVYINLDALSKEEGRFYDLIALQKWLLEVSDGQHNSSLSYAKGKGSSNKSSFVHRA
jgi:hypothetical protein